MTPIQRDGGDWIVRVAVKPRARRTRFGDAKDGEIIVFLAAAPVDGEANDALIRFVAEVFETAPSRVVVERGGTSRHKRLRIGAARCVPEALSGFLKGPAALI